MKALAIATTGGELSGSGQNINDVRIVLCAETDACYMGVRSETK
jgi:hypothetical protein